MESMVKKRAESGLNRSVRINIRGCYLIISFHVLNVSLQLVEFLLFTIT